LVTILERSKYIVILVNRKGFTKEQIKQYANNINYTLEELLKDSDAQIDSMIKHKILFDLYENNT
jgi:hypothetical protein